MSYEGRTQMLCKNGHLDECDCNDEVKECYYCKAPIEWYNAVDDTNCDAWGIIPKFILKTLILQDEQLETCPTCQHVSCKSPAVYRIPDAKETMKLQHKYDESTGTYVPLLV